MSSNPTPDLEYPSFESLNTTTVGELRRKDGPHFAAGYGDLDKLGKVLGRAGVPTLDEYLKQHKGLRIAAACVFREAGEDAAFRFVPVRIFVVCADRSRWLWPWRRRPGILCVMRRYRRSPRTLIGLAAVE